MSSGTFDEDKSAWASNPAIADLTASVGTADGTVQDATAAFDQTITNNNNREFATKINAILAAMRNAGIIAQD
jgi:hypothetical protein